MYDRPDGGFSNRKVPLITFVIYGPIEEPVAGAFQGSIESYIYSIGRELEKFPSFMRIYRNNPKITTFQNQNNILLEDMQDVEGNLKIGLTDVTFYSPSDRKNIFGSGNSEGMSVFSLTRFRKECPGKREFFNNIEKESIKFLSLALGIPNCPDPRCIITYHRHVTDLDLNDYVCPDCRKAIIDKMNDFFYVSNLSDGARA
jgi:predicted Zn-dependent protease